MRKFAVVLCALLLMTIIALLVWHKTYNSVIAELRNNGYNNLDRIIGQFEGNLSQFRTLATLVARQPDVVKLALNPTSSYLPDGYFGLTAATSGASRIVLYNSEGQAISAHAQEIDTDNDTINPNVSSKYYFKRAMNGALGFEYVVDEETDTRKFIFARSVLGRQNLQWAVVAVEVSLGRFEDEWSSLKETVIFVDDNNTVALSNRANLLHRPLSQTRTGSIENDAVYVGEVEHEPKARFLPLGKIAYGAGIIQRDVPIYELRAFLFVDDTVARNSALLSMGLVFALVGFLISVIYAIWSHQRHLRSQLQSEQTLALELEKRVEEKSKQLQATQHDLVQAAKLTALGKMSAGIGHELNQPIGAIKNFAINGKRLLARKQLDLVDENLFDIATQADRMARIISHLRAFARHEPVVISKIDVVSTVKSALKLNAAELDRAGVKVNFHPEENEYWVQGGKVRLEQVIVNLMNNAIDAMKNSAEKEICFEIVKTINSTQLSIRDTGHGIQDADNVFEPFFTTKTVDQGHGLGLGLSISHGIVASLNGHLSCENHARGATFTIELLNTNGEAGSV